VKNRWAETEKTCVGSVELFGEKSQAMSLYSTSFISLPSVTPVKMVLLLKN
jgi:hypothetical protein